MSRKYESEQVEECVKYFRQNPVWNKVLKGFQKKYVSYGRFSGSVVVRNLTQEEIEELEGFFGKSFHRQKSVSISAEKFQKALENSRYKNIKPDMILESYFGRPLLSRQEEGLLKEQKRQEIIRRVTSDYEGTPVQSEVEYIMHMLKGNSREDFGELEQQLYLSAEIFNKLPYRKEQKIYLAVFAAMLTGNPHAFDNGTAAGNFLYQMIQMDLFAKSGNRVYYAGDLDPEGILIAQKLSQYYKGEFHYWHMETADYEKCRSEEVISPKRMKILERITDERLKPVVDRIEEYGTAGYQEMLVEEM